MAMMASGVIPEELVRINANGANGSQGFISSMGIFQQGHLWLGVYPAW